jgi:SPP1 family predicted phage head-tail adaptor
MSERVPSLGTLTDRVQIKTLQSVGDGAGGHERVYMPLSTVWARVRSLSGRQGTNADGQAVAISHSVVMRFRGDLGPGDRLVYRGRNLDVVSAADLNGRKAYLSCACSETSVTG